MIYGEGGKGLSSRGPFFSNFFLKTAELSKSQSTKLKNWSLLHSPHWRRRIEPKIWMCWTSQGWTRNSGLGRVRPTKTTLPKCHFWNPSLSILFRMKPPELALNYKKGGKFKKCFFFFAALTSFSKRQIPSLFCVNYWLWSWTKLNSCVFWKLFFWLSSEKSLFFIEKKSMYLKKKFWGILILYYILI